MPRSWCRFTAFADAGRAEIMIMDFIGQWGYGAAEFMHDLRQLGDVQALDVVISSNGGDPLVAFAVAELMRAHPAKITTRVAGVAASAASIIAMAGDEVVMGQDSFMMIHDATADVGMSGPLSSDELRSAAEALDRIQGQIVAFYARKTGMDDERIRELMAASTWMTAEEAVEMKFADRIEDRAVKMAARIDLSVLSNVPAALAGLAAGGDTPQAAHEDDDMTVKPNPAGADPVVPNPSETPTPPTNPAPIPTPTPIQQPTPAAIDSARAEGQEAAMAHVAEIMELCTLAGQADKAPGFIAARKPVADVRKELVEARATTGDAIDTRQNGGGNQAGASWGDVYKPFRAENARPFGQRM